MRRRRPIGKPRKPERSLRKPPPLRRKTSSRISESEDLDKQPDWFTECGLKGVAAEVRQVARELGERLRCCGDIEGRKGDEGGDDEEGATFIDDEGEEIELGPPPITNEVVVFHGAHIVALAHEAGINVSLLPELKAALPPNEVRGEKDRKR
jgi:hypothetical protein